MERPLAELLEHDAAAREQLLRYCRGLTRHGEAAKDLAQEAMARALASKRVYRLKEGRVLPLLKVIAKRVWFDEWRKRRTEQKYQPVLVEPVNSASESVEEQVVNRVSAGQAIRAIYGAGLGFALLTVAELSDPDCDRAALAREKGVDPTTLSTRLNRRREELNRFLHEHELGGKLARARASMGGRGVSRSRPAAKPDSKDTK